MRYTVRSYKTIPGETGNFLKSHFLSFLSLIFFKNVWFLDGKKISSGQLFRLKFKTFVWRCVTFFKNI